MATVAAGCSSPGGASTTSATGSLAPITVTSTLAGHSKLPLRIYWEAIPSVPATQVLQVDFLIDDVVVLDDRTPPYVYGGAGNYLVTSFLTPGKHTFTVGVITLSNQTNYAALSTVIATVAAPLAPPDGLAGKWARTVTTADVNKATSEPLPLSGHWQLTIDPKGWGLVAPYGRYQLFDVAYQSSAILLMRSAIATPSSPASEFCSPPDFAHADPNWFWTVTVAIGGGDTTLTLHPQGLDPCGNRAAVLEGIWRLVSK